MSPALIVAVVAAVVVDLISLNLLTSLARAVPVERRVRRLSRRTMVAPLPIRLRQLETLMNEVVAGDLLAQARAGVLIRESFPGSTAGLDGRLDLARLDQELLRIEDGNGEPGRPVQQGR